MEFAVEISLPSMPRIGWSPGLSDKVELFDFNLTERGMACCRFFGHEVKLT